MRKIYLLFFTVLLPCLAFSQGEANVWYFGQNAGLDFNSGFPVVLNDGQMTAPEGCAVMSNANGELLFYTNGATVWNRNHDTLSNGFGLLGGLSSTQSSLIIPKPGSTNIYYIFTTSQTQQSGNWNFCYSEVDMNLDGGLGGITSNKNILLYTPIGEKITAIKHSNNADIWVVTHAKFTNAYLTFAITSAGVNTNPIVFNGGTVDNGTGDGFASPNWGYMKASPDGSKIAAAFTVMNRTDVLDFNRSTGQLNLSFTINQVAQPYAIEFSPNSLLLYIASLSAPVIRQYNLTLATPAAIVSSSFNIPVFSTSVTGALQLGPDEKIYFASQEHLGVINNPDQIGIGCNFSPNAVELGDGYAFLGLPNFFSYYLTPSGIEHVGSCVNDSTFFTYLDGNQADSVVWNFGDPNSGISNTSTSLSPFHIYQNPGTYIVSVTTFQGSVINTVTKPVTILPIPEISIGDDIAFCIGTSGALFITNAQPGFSYNWFFENAQSQLVNFSHPFTSLAVSVNGTYYATASNSCGVSTDTALAVMDTPLSDFYMGLDFSHCEGSPIFLSTLNSGYGDYLWQDGSTSPFLVVNQTGTYWAQVSNSCGSVSDTIEITILPFPSVSLGSDTTFCNGTTIQITPTGIFDEFTWDNGISNSPLSINESGNYSIVASNFCGAVYDTLSALEISTPIEINFQDTVLFCEGDSIVLNVSQPNVSYVWQNGSTSSQFTITESGEYFVTVFNDCGAISDTLFSTVNPLPTVSLGEDIHLCNQASVTLIADGIASNYVWSEGSTNPTITVDSSGTYAVSGSNSCGSVSDTILVRLGNNSEQTIEFNVCEPILVNGIVYNESGSYTQTLINASGCDSILTIEAEIQNFNAQIFQTDTTLYFNGNPTSIQWFNCATGQIIAGENNPVFVPQQTGTYGAIITIGECVDTSNCRLIPVPPIPQTPPDLCENIRVSPNPVSDVTSFILDKDNYAIRLFSSTGALIWQKAGTPEKQEIDFRNYAPAMYVLEVDQCRFKIVKQ